VLTFRIHPSASSLDAAVARTVVDALAATLRERGSARFIASSGRTPRGVYALLRTVHRGALDWSRVTVVQMDEYVGLPPHDPTSLAWSLHRQLVGPLGLGFLSLNGPHGRLARDLDEHDGMARGADLVLHGLGRNGHVGFNEPPSGPDHPTRCVRLAAETRADNGLPTSVQEGITLGLDCLLTAQTTLVAAKGRTKADAVAAMVSAPASEDCPASWLRGIPCEVHLDPAAGRALSSPPGVGPPPT
jgi:glucosamine-6-phosphate deaminase